MAVRRHGPAKLRYGMLKGASCSFYEASCETDWFRNENIAPCWVGQQEIIDGKISSNRDNPVLSTR
jgi:hypothetical protein